MNMRKDVRAEEISFIKAAYDMNYALFEEGLKNERTTYARHLLKKERRTDPFLR